MATQPRMSMVACKAALDAIRVLVDGGAGAGTIQVRTGAAPATTLTADSGTLLCTLTMSDPAFGAATSAEANGKAKITAAAIASDTNADASDTAGHFRIKDSNGVCIFQGTCGTSSADLIFDDVVIDAGDTVAITAFVVRLANGTASE